ncbi:MAG TPA: hypothetical protein VFC21_09595 [Bryobacteraceae bacterium]|nr:hypothetical protein [Bryobacteraceae bacterium]
MEISTAETSTAPSIAAEGWVVDGIYRIGACLAERDRQASYETSWQNCPAVIRLIAPGTREAATALLAGFRAGQKLRHPNLLKVYALGEVAIRQTPCVYVVTERPDENLAGVLRGRALDPEETHQILEGVFSALECIHANGYVYGQLRPAEIFACGETIKLSADCVRPLSVGSPAGDSPGLYDAPETASGVRTESGDMWSVGVLTLECLTRSPYASEIDRLSPPFREIVEGGMTQDPALRWSLSRMRAALSGRLPSNVSSQAEAPPPRPGYRRYAAIAVGGALVAAAICALLVRSIHQGAQASPVPVPVSASPAKPDMTETPATTDAPAIPRGWAVVDSVYALRLEAERRAIEIRTEHPKLNPKVFSASTAGNAANARFLIVYSSGLSETQAKRQLQRARGSGGPRDIRIMRFR